MDLVNWLFLECEAYFDDMPNASGYTWDDGVYHTYRLLYDTSSEMNSVGHEIFPIPFLYLPEIRSENLPEKEKEHGFILHTDNFHRRYILIPEGQRKFLNICSWMGG